MINYEVTSDEKFADVSEVSGHLSYNTFTESFTGYVTVNYNDGDSKTVTGEMSESEFEEDFGFILKP